MQALIDYLLSLQSVRLALVARGWIPPQVDPKAGGGPRPNK